jgi:hypothetical protein
VRGVSPPVGKPLTGTVLYAPVVMSIVMPSMPLPPCHAEKSNP